MATLRQLFAKQREITTAADPPKIGDVSVRQVVETSLNEYPFCSYFTYEVIACVRGSNGPQALEVQRGGPWTSAQIILGPLHLITQHAQTTQVLQQRQK